MNNWADFWTGFAAGGGMTALGWLISHLYRSQDRAERRQKEEEEKAEKRRKEEEEKAEKRRKERNARISAVVDAYKGPQSRHDATPRFRAVVNAGIAELHDGDEVREVLAILDRRFPTVRRAGQQFSFLGPYHDRIVMDPKIDPLIFFRELEFSGHLPCNVQELLLRLSGSDTQADASPEFVQQLEQNQREMEEPARKKRDLLKALRRRTLG